MNPRPQSTTEWLRAFLPLGVLRDDRWQPVGGAVLLLDKPIAWLVTASTALHRGEGEAVATWVTTTAGPRLFDFTGFHRQHGLDWIHHPAGISATPFPIDDSFVVKAFGEAHCTRVRDLQPLLPCATVGCMFGVEAITNAHLSPAVHDGAIAFVDARSGHVFATAPMFPRNAGAPLLLASPYGGAVTLAGILLDQTSLHEADPRAVPLRLARAICVDAALELIRGKDANALREAGMRKRQEGQP